MKYFTEEGLTEQQKLDFELIDVTWQQREGDPDWEFIHKAEIKQHKGFDKNLWSHIKDLIPVQRVGV